MPEKARVFVAEDDPDWQRRIDRVLTKAGHNVVGKANTLPKALEAVERFEQMGVQVATIDGNLNEYDWRGDDGRALVAAIKRLAPNVKTVSMSGGSAIEGTDAVVGKRKVDTLGAIVTRL